MKKLFVFLIIIFSLASCNNVEEQQTYNSIEPNVVENFDYLHDYGDFVNQFIQLKDNAPSVVGDYKIFRNEVGEILFSYNDDLKSPTSGMAFHVASDDNGDLKALYVYNILDLINFNKLELIQEYYVDNDRVYIKSYEKEIFDDDFTYLYLENNITYELKSDKMTVEQLHNETYANFYLFGQQLNKVFNRKSNDEYAEFIITNKTGADVNSFVPVGWDIYNNETRNIKGVLSGKLNNDNYTDYLVTIEKNTNDVDQHNKYIFPRISFILYGSKDNKLVLGDFLSDLVPSYYVDYDPFYGFIINNKTITIMVNSLDNSDIAYTTKYIFNPNVKKWQFIGYTLSQLKTYNTTQFTLVEDYNLINGNLKTTFTDNTLPASFEYKEFWDKLPIRNIFYDSIKSNPLVNKYFPVNNHTKYYNELFN